MKTLARHLIGYTLGTFVFLGVMPLAIYVVARFIEPRLGIEAVQFGLPQSAVVAALAIVGLSFGVGSNLFLFFVGRGGPFDGFGYAVSPRSKHLVVTGPYRYTRNPMVFGALSCYLAWALYLGSILCVAAIILSPLLILPYLRWAEERRLASDFSEEFTRYKARTSMLIPWPPRRPTP